MNHWQTRVLTIVLFGTLTSGLLADEKKADPSGTWRWEYEMQGETFKDSMRLNLNDDGKVVGKFYGTNREAKVEEGKMDGDKLSATISLDINGTAVRLVFSGPMTEDEIDGKVVAEFNGENREYPWKPKRSVKLEDVVGSWDLRIEGENNVFEPTMKISKQGEDYQMVYTTDQGTELDVKELKVDDNHLKFTVTAEYDGDSMKVDFKGRPYGDKLTGSLDYDFGGNVGEAEFTGKRKPAKE